MRYTLLLIAILFVSGSVATILSIANGGTNAAAMLNNGKLMYSTIGSIIEAQPLQSADGKSLSLVDLSAGITPTANTKFQLIGMNNNNSATAGFATYTSSDNYTLLQTLPFAHNDISLNFDFYWDLVSTWRSSYSASNFQIYKYLSKLNFNYGSGSAQGSTVSLPTAISIGSDGKTTYGQAIKLPTSGGTASDLDYYTEYSISVSICTFPFGSGANGCVPAGSTTLRFVRLGAVVSMTIPTITVTTASGSSIALLVTSVPAGLLPNFSSSQMVSSIPINEGGCKVGQIHIYDNTHYDSLCGCIITDYQFRIYEANGGVMSTGTVGTCGENTIRYLV